MNEIVLEWESVGSFRSLVCDPNAWVRFSYPGVYVWTERRDGQETPVYVGRASQNPNLMQRLTRHYLGSIGALYYLEPRLSSRRTSEEATARFRAATQVLKDRLHFLDQVQKGFDEMERYNVYVAPCDAAVARIAEAALIRQWHTGTNKRKEKTGSEGEVLIRHQGQLPASLIGRASPA